MRLGVDAAARLDQRVCGPAAAEHQHNGLLRAQQRGRLAARGALRGHRAAAAHERAQAAARRRRQQPAAHDEQQILSRRRTTQTRDQVSTLSISAGIDLLIYIGVPVLAYTALHACLPRSVQAYVIQAHSMQHAGIFQVVHN